MEDTDIMELYFSRSENAIPETKMKYGNMILAIAMRILNDRSDAEECENDTYMGLWNVIPPQRPYNFYAFIAKTARNLALKKYHFINAEKRKPQAAVSLSELEECISGNDGRNFSDGDLSAAINDFLGSLNEENRKIFLLRYWYFLSIKGICKRLGVSKSKAESSLFRTRKKLKKFLTERGLY